MVNVGSGLLNCGHRYSSFEPTLDNAAALGSTPATPPLRGRCALALSQRHDVVSISASAGVNALGTGPNRPSRPTSRLDAGVGETTQRDHTIPVLKGYSVSTQTRFDLIGLIQAIESSDYAYQVALYAEHAEVQIADGDTIGQAPKSLPVGQRLLDGLKAWPHATSSTTSSTYGSTAGP